MCLYIHTHIIGWSNNHFNNLHVKVSLKTKEITTCAADKSSTCCVCLNHRLLNLNYSYSLSIMHYSIFTIQYDLSIIH